MGGPRMIWECPECETTVIGSEDDFVRHLRSEHPLEARIVVDDGKTLEERVRMADSERKED